MSKKQWLQIFLINFVIAIVILSPFLPGPSSLSTIINTIYTILQFASLFLIITIPIGLVITVNQIIKKEKMSLLFMLLWTLPATGFSVTLWGADIARDFSRKIAINNATTIIHAIEQYHRTHKKFPDQLSDLKSEFLKQIPSTGVMGIATYQYEKRDSSFAVIFTQNILAGFNREFVSYDPRHQFSLDDSLNEVYPAGKDKWSYYIAD